MIKRFLGLSSARGRTEGLYDAPGEKDCYDNPGEGNRDNPGKKDCRDDYAPGEGRQQMEFQHCPPGLSI